MLLAVLAATLTTGSLAWADPIQVTYTTEGVVGETSLYGSPVVYWPIASAGSRSTTTSDGINGAPVMSFVDINNGELTAGQSFSLGQFAVTPMAAGTSTTYTNTPFQIAFTERTINGVLPSPNATPVVLHGWLSGSVNASGSSNIRLSIDTFETTPESGPPFPTTAPPFRVGDTENYLYVLSVGGADSPIQAELNLAQSAPEPGTLVIFGVLILGLGHYHRRRACTQT
jgi:hypothetical protein